MRPDRASPRGSLRGRPRGTVLQGLPEIACICVGVVAGLAVLGGLGVPSALPVWGIAGPILLYLASHGCRAVRLALLATPLLGTSGRSAALLQLVTAPAALVLPLKLGELLRFQQLHRLGAARDWLLPLVVLVLDRLMDAVLIVCLFGLVWIQSGGTTMLSGAVVLSMAMLTVAMILFGVLPGALTTLQRYILVNHQAALPRRALGTIDRLRHATTMGARQIAVQGGLVGIVSVAIWTLEFAGVSLLLMALAGAAPETAARHDGTAELLLARTAAEWGALAGLVDDPAMRLSATLGLAALATVWPLCLYLYLRRRRLEPMRARSIDGGLPNPLRKRPMANDI